MGYGFHHFPVMSIGSRIEAARKRKGWSQGQLAEAVGKGQTTISSWERDRTEPTREDVVRIASKLGIPLVEIEDVLIDRPRAVAFEIPLLSWVSAGEVRDIGVLQNASPEDQIAVANLPVGEYFATEVRGDSMDRISPERSRIIVNVRDKRLVPGRAYVFSIRGETTYKIYQADPAVRLEPYSTNPLNRTIFPKKDNDWFVVGRVVRSWFDLP